MGWDSNLSHTKKSQVVADLNARYARGGYQVHGFSVTRSALFQAVTTPHGASLILVHLIEKRDGSYWVKSMSEDSGPFELDCPLSLLEMVPGTGGEYSIDWRVKVRAYHARKSVDLIGREVELYGVGYRVVGRVARSYRVERLSDGKPFRLGMKQAAQVEIK